MSWINKRRKNNSFTGKIRLSWLVWEAKCKWNKMWFSYGYYFYYYLVDGYCWQNVFLAICSIVGDKYCKKGMKKKKHETEQLFWMRVCALHTSNPNLKHSALLIRKSDADTCFLFPSVSLYRYNLFAVYWTGPDIEPDLLGRSEQIMATPNWTRQHI